MIFEYKRSRDENVINQGLFYLDWLLDHQAEFKLLVMEHLGAEAAKQIDWTNPRLVCIAGDFTRYDEHFACVEVHPQSRTLLVYLKVDPDAIGLEQGFSRDVRGIGHFGTGSLELRLKDSDDLAKAESLILTSYEVS